MGTNAVALNLPLQGTGYNRTGGQFVRAEALVMLPLAAYGSGVNAGPVFDCGGAHTLRLRCAVTAKSGTSPTLDVSVMTSPDGVNDWRSVSTFAQKTDAAAAPNDGLVMGAVTSSGTTPPVITLTGTQVQPVNLKITCTLLGARGTWTGAYSIDGGVTTVAFTSAATVAVLDVNGTDTGVVINIAAGTAATDNVWTASTVGYERKSFTGLDRFARCVGLVGGSSTPIITGYVDGRLVY